MNTLNKTQLILALIALLPRVAPAQLTLSGLTLYGSDANGTWDRVYGWNTLSGNAVDAFNLYLFTGTTGSPTFLTSGNTDASLDPNAPLSVGFHSFSFA